MNLTCYVVRDDMSPLRPLQGCQTEDYSKHLNLLKVPVKTEENESAHTEDG